jgi:hypothetical protein
VVSRETGKSKTFTNPDDIDLDNPELNFMPDATHTTEQKERILANMINQYSVAHTSQKARIADLTKKQSDLKKLNTTLLNKIASLKKEKEEFSRQRESDLMVNGYITARAQAIPDEEVKKQITRLNKIIATNTVDMIKMNASLSAAQDKANALTRENTQTKSLLSKHSALVVRLREQKERLNESIEFKNAELVNIRETLKQTKIDCEIARGSAHREKKRATTIQSTYDKMSKQLSKVQNDGKVKRDKLCRANAELKKLQKLCFQNSATIAKQRTAIADMLEQAKVTELEQANQAKVTELEQANQAKVTELEQANQAKVAELEQANQANQAKVAELEQSNQANQAKVAELEQANQDKVAKLKQSSQDKIARLEQHNRIKLDKQSQKHGTLVTSITQRFQARFTEQSNEIKKLTADLRGKLAVIESLQKSTNYDTLLTCDDVAKQADTKKLLEQSLREHSETKRLLKKATIDRNADLNRFSAKMKEFKDFKRVMEFPSSKNPDKIFVEYNTMRDRNLSLNKQITSQKEISRDLNKQVDYHKDQVNQTIIDYSAMADRNIDLTRQVDDLTQQICVLTERVRDSEFNNICSSMLVDANVVENWESYVCQLCEIKRHLTPGSTISEMGVGLRNYNIGELGLYHLVKTIQINPDFVDIIIKMCDFTHSKKCFINTDAMNTRVKLKNNPHPDVRDRIAELRDGQFKKFTDSYNPAINWFFYIGLDA